MQDKIATYRLIGNKSSKCVEKFKYQNTAVTNQNYLHEKIKSSFNSGNSCYHLVQNLLSSSLISKNMKIEMFKNIISPLVLYGCKT